jgi:hypothetical protein
MLEVTYETATLHALGRRRLLRVLGGLGLALCTDPSGALAAESAPLFRIVINKENPFMRLERQFVADVFLKNIREWEDGHSIAPVDLRADSPVRADFSKRVLQRSVGAVRNYWQQRIFAGRGVPPPELDSDAAVIAFVTKNRDAVGYVSAAAPLTDVKILTVG